MDAQRASAASALRQRASLQALAGARAKRDRAVHATWPASHTDSLRDMDRTCPRPRRDRLLIAWLHIPKCGTSFGNTLFHFANRSLPENASMDAVAAEARLAAARRGHQKASIRKGLPRRVGLAATVSDVHVVPGHLLAEGSRKVAVEPPRHQRGCAEEVPLQPVRPLPRSCPPRRERVPPLRS